MSPSLDGIVTAVVERLQAMAHAQRRYPHHRRSPRAYIKKLKDTSRMVPQQALPTGPMPDEPWYEPYEDEAEVPLIGEAICTYNKEHAHRTTMSRYQIERSISSLLDFTKLHENMPIWTITREACKRWRVALMDGTCLSTKQKGRIPNAVTIEKRMKMASHFLNWCVAREFLPANPLQGLSLPTRLVAASKVRKTSFSDEELSKIIPALLALPVDDVPRTEFKWASLALIFSGARCMEVVQLRHQDIRQVDGIWCFDITLDEGTHLKNHPSVRLVPLHSQLIQLGFLEWVSSQASGEPSARVFPLIHPKGSPLISMWFTRILKALNIKRPEVSLHSTRHSFTVKLAQQRTFPQLSNRLLGHSAGKSTEERVYLAGLQFSVKELQEALEKIRYPVTV